MRYDLRRHHIGVEILQAARKEADFYFNQASKSLEAAKMIERVQNDARMKLAAVG